MADRVCPGPDRCARDGCRPRPAASAALTALAPGCAEAPLAPPKIDRISAEQLEALLPQPVAALPLEQVVALAQQGIAADDHFPHCRLGLALPAVGGTDPRTGGAGRPREVLDHMVATERRRIFDDMATEANRRDAASARAHRAGAPRHFTATGPIGPMMLPGPYPFPMINCFPLSPGSPFWRCL